MKRIAWVTPDWFIDVDLPILKTFNSDLKLDITSYFIFHKDRVNNYNIDIIINELDSKSIKVNYLFLNKRFRSIETLFQLFQFLFKIRSTNPDVLYLGGNIKPYLSILVKLFFDSNKVIIAIHDVEPHVGVSKIFHFLLNFDVKLFANFHVFSETQNNIFSLKYKYKRVFCIPLFLQQFGESIKVPEKAKINFLFFGTIRKNKGLEYLIEAANKLAVSHKGKFVVKIAGKCNEWSFFENLIIDNDVFDLSIQAVPNEKIADLYCQANYIILPYKDVTQSGPLMLAFNYGIPPIASNLPGFMEHIIDNETGYLFESENSDSLYEIMSKIVDSDNTGFNTLKSNLLKYVNDKYNANKIKSLYSDMFDDVIEK